jgi:hypothetical protein
MGGLRKRRRPLTLALVPRSTGGEGTRQSMPRALINIDPKEVEGYARLGSPVMEIADYIGVHESTIRRRFRREIRNSRAARRISLRQFQWKEARGGNVTMLTFLGKLELGQRDDQAGVEDRMIVRRAVKRS